MNFSLKSKFFFPHAAVLILFLTILYIFSSQCIKDSEEKFQKNTLDNLFTFIKDDLKDPIKLQAIIKKLEKTKSLFNLTHLTQKDFFQLQKKMNTDKNLFHFTDTKKNLIVYAFKNNSNNIHYLKLEYKGEFNSKNTLKNLLRLILIIAFVLLSFFFISIQIFSRTLVKTIRKISEITRSINLDEYDKKIINIHQDSLGMIGVEFNYLIRRVRTHLKRRNHIEQIRREFTSNVSHELKTPLTSIKGYTETLIEGALYDNKNNMHFLKIINKNIDRLIQLVKDLLELSYIESNEKFMDLSPVGWRSILKDSYSRWELEMKKKNINFSYNYPPGLPKVLANKRALSHILDNLVQNACYYNHQKGSVHIRFEEQTETISLIIKDTGIGISEKDQKRIFERFFRVDSSRTSTSGHSGIGLAIVKHLVMQLQGSITLKSELGQGSEFIVTLKKSL